MAKAQIKLQSMNVDALLKLRDDIGTVLSYKRKELETQLQRLDGKARRPRRGSLEGVKVAPKYRGPSGETWAGRGAMPRWLAALKKEGHIHGDEILLRGPSNRHLRKRASARRTPRRGGSKSALQFGVAVPPGC
jgi:DNA-binding protein H-NS